MASIPVSIAVPAAAAGLAYLNARFGVASDLSTVPLLLSYRRLLERLAKQDRVNIFYRFEELAKDPKTAAKVFLVVPKEEANSRQRTQWTYAEAYETVLKYARWLKDEHGIQKNEIVAIDFTNQPQFIWVWFALWSLGAKPAFINSNLRGNAFVHCVRISTARLLVVDASIREVMNDDTHAELSPDGRGRGVQAHILDDTEEERILAGPIYRAPDEARSGELPKHGGLLIYTSGTTGLPKAANVGWARALGGMYVFPKLLRLTADDRYFTAMPLYHSSAALLGVCQVLGAGCTLIVAPKFSPRTYMKMVVETKATIIQYIGEACRYLVSSPPTPYDKAHTVRLAFGNGMRPDVWQKFKDRFNIPDVCEFYGATEAPGSSIVYERNGFLRGSIGRTGALFEALFGSNAVLVKHDHNTDMPYRDPKTGFCVKCKRDEVGELLNLLDAAAVEEKYQGYLGNEKATESKVLRNVFKKGDAYYRAGDLQRHDKDGRWWFVDRVGDTFRWKSENVSTAEVSEALGSHPAIREANVYGVQLPNHDGRAGCAAVGFASGKALDAGLRRELASHVRNRLPRYAVPIFLRVMGDELEVTGTLKHQKVALRNQGVDPSKVEGDELFWLPPGAESYEPFGKQEWDRIVTGSAKL
ncbi:hypothetical protein BAUCODRAFT_132516 [Baudoinia panamericana UAMH 10762]|uniref:Very long-chain fatty acid transport protein n=1 Tax=Baudoinia panamericana (strain UAMH 10762) TaxID=717646 RepID=M2LK92_BAUPA|nr:uncharacterized protein BAUCODRAFT_132516 [Baudoinia panamericana UAMH 10762]EMC94672.1 hypothetical protein BAUCODRAFT_132516 [Baudoinia panamericana UAMH 10762]